MSCSTSYAPHQRIKPEGPGFARLFGTIANYINGLPYSIITLDIIDGRIQEIDIVVNPDKLRGIPALNKSGAGSPIPFEGIGSVTQDEGEQEKDSPTRFWV